jgi:hypothetical protein
MLFVNLEGTNTILQQVLSLIPCIPRRRRAIYLLKIGAVAKELDGPFANTHLNKIRILVYQIVNQGRDALATQDALATKTILYQTDD